MRRAAPALLALSLLQVALLPIPVPASGGPPPFGIGDWTVTGNETLQGQSLLLDGNLTVESGGSLSILSSTLRILSGPDHPHEIRVRDGGELKVLAGSDLGSFDTSEELYARAGFWAEAGASVDFQNSTFTSMGIFDLGYIGSTMIGGVCIFTDDSVLYNCTFTGSRIGLTIIYASARVLSCRFTENHWGAISYHSPAEFVDCTFDQNFNGAVAYRSTPAFLNCTFSDNANGAIPDGSTCTLKNCNFTHNIRNGIYCDAEMGEEPAPAAADIIVEDCRFERNRVGINAHFYRISLIPPIALYHTLRLVGSDFIDNTEFGLLWPYRIRDDPIIMSPCTWTVEGNSTLVNETVKFNGKITLDSPSELVLRGSVLKLDPDVAGWARIEVQSGGRLRLLDKSSLMAANATAPYQLVFEAGSAFEMNRSFLQNCGWETATAGSSGPSLNRSGVRIVDSSIDSCPCPLILDGVPNAVIEGSSLSGYWRGICLSSSSARMQNSSLGSPETFEVTLTGASVLDCVNSSVDRQRVEFEDSESRLELAWYLDVEAAWSDGRPAAGANLSLTDSLGQEVLNESADAEGRMEGILLREASVSPNSTTDFTPHRLRCWGGPVQNETEITMDRSQRLGIILTDYQPPSISVLYPRNGDFLNSSRVQVGGRAEDNLAVGTVELTVDSSRHHMLYQSSGVGLAGLDWDLTLQLPEGSHTLEAVATDHSGNQALVHITFTVDIFEPRILITSPPDGLLTNLTEVGVSGVVEPGVEVFVNGEAVRTMANTFSGVARLSEGQNLIEARAVDRAGNSNSSSVTVRLDTVPPRLDVRFDPQAQEVNQPEVMVFGEMEMGAAITVNGRRVVLPGLADGFSTQLFLVPGPNLIRVEAVDAAGNLNTVLWRMVLDTVPPALEVVYPPEGLLTRSPLQDVLLNAEAGSNLTFGGTIFYLDGTPGNLVNLSLPITLVEGPNTLLVRARDAAGNSAGITLRVTLDTTPPVLELVSPANNSQTDNATVYIIGSTDPDARLTVGGERVQVGYGGAFSFEARLAAGTNRIVVRAEDRLGNSVERSVVVLRAPASGGATGPTAGPDWPFLGFLCLSVALAAGEGAWAARRLGWPKEERRKRGVG